MLVAAESTGRARNLPATNADRYLGESSMALMNQPRRFPWGVTGGGGANPGRAPQVNLHPWTTSGYISDGLPYGVEFISNRQGARPFSDR